MTPLLHPPMTAATQAGRSAVEDGGYSKAGRAWSHREREAVVMSVKHDRPRHRTYKIPIKSIGSAGIRELSTRLSWVPVFLGFFLGFLGFFAFLFFILWAEDASMIASTEKQCSYKFPMWFGCVLANHETLAGSLIAAGGALFAAWIAWRAVRNQIQADRDIARKADRAYVIGGPGARQFDDDKNEIGIVSTAMNTGKTPGSRKEFVGGFAARMIGPRLRRAGLK